MGELTELRGKVEEVMKITEKGGKEEKKKKKDSRLEVKSSIVAKPTEQILHALEAMSNIHILRSYHLKMHLASANPSPSPSLWRDPRCPHAPTVTSPNSP